MKQFFSILLLVISYLPAMAQWALPHVSAAHVRTEPRHGAELSTQALMGTPLQVDSVTSSDWVAVTMPDGYKGFVIGNSLTMMDTAAFDRWRGAMRGVVTARHEVRAYNDTLGYEPVADLVAGDIVEILPDSVELRCHVALPDGREGWVFRSEIVSLDSLCYESMEDILSMARAQTGVPYLWGGLSVKGMDCSGLTKLAFFSAGIILPRDASMQAFIGEPVEIDSLKPGDLVFYGNPDTGRINHVAIYEGNDRVIEAAGRVRHNTLHGAGKYVTSRRITPGTLPTVSTHPWYHLQ